MDKQAFSNPAAQPTTLPYSPGLIAGPFVFVSGQVGIEPRTGEVVGSDTESQTRQALENVRGLLAVVGLGMEDVVKTTVFLTRIEDFQAMNRVYRQFFPEPLPCRTTVGVAALARPELAVEIEVLALRRS